VAVRGADVNALGDGIQANAPSKGSFALNMLHLNNSWQVRKGFGQVTQFDTTMANPIEGATAEWGYRKHLGSSLIKTNFGNLQMLSVFIADVNTAEIQADDAAGEDAAAPVFPVYLVSIYDITTKERFEVPLYIHTSQTTATASFTDVGTGDATGRGSSHPPSVEEVPDAAGQYQTCAGQSFAAWIKASDEFFFFEEHRDILYFGNSVVGLWAYLPASFNGSRPMSIDMLNERGAAQAYSESSMITPVVLSPGINTDAFVYLRASDMPKVTDVAVVQNRMVYASDFSLFFSDPGFPSSIMASNFIQVPSEERVVAIAEHNSNVLIFTQNETWLYQPSVGAIVSAGKLTRVSDHVGCVGPNAITSMGEALVWVDDSGVYATTGGLTINPLSNDVMPFFGGEGMPNPLTSFYADGGATNAGEQYEISLDMRSDGVKATYVPALRTAFLTIPALDGALALTDGKWAWWSFQSIANGPDIDSGILSNIEAPWLLAHQDDLFLLGGADVQPLDDTAIQFRDYAPFFFPLERDTTSRSFYILQYGRGGAIDRSVSSEDHRRVTGSWQRQESGPVLGTGGLYFHDPIPIPVGYTFLNGVTSTDANMFWVPVSLVLPNDTFSPSSPEGVDRIEAHVSFDATHWRPVSNGAGGVDIYVPPERLPIGPPAVVPAITATTYDDAALTIPSATGPYMQILFDGGAVGPVWTHKPYLNLQHNRHNPICFIPMGRIIAPFPFERNTSTMAWYCYSGPNLQDTGAAPPIDVDVGFYVFNRWSLGSAFKRVEDRVAQPVDWAYKSTNIGLEQGDVVKLRGTWTNLLSHGTGTDRLDTVALTWPYGLFNTALGSDRKEWINQFVDYTGDPPAIESINDTQTLRTRVKRSDGALVNKTFQTGGADIVWGQVGVGAADGNVVVGDEDTSIISVSTSMKGQSVSVMHFGHMMNRAEKVMIEGIVATLRARRGSRRRRGR